MAESDDSKAKSDLQSREIELDAAAELFPVVIDNIDSATLMASYNRLQHIYHLGQAICRERELDKVLNVVLDSLTSFIKLERSFIAILNNGKPATVATH